MDTIKTSKYHALAALESNNFKSKSNLKLKEEKPKSYYADEGSYFIYEGLNSKNKGNKKEISKCTYCRKPYHNEKYFFKNNMDIMTKFL